MNSDISDEECDSITFEENENFTDEVDPEHLEYLQNQFQDDIVNEIFEDIVEYIDTNALPLCEFMSKDDVEVAIDELQTC